MTDPTRPGPSLYFISGDSGGRSTLTDMISVLGIEDDSDLHNLMANREVRLLEHATEIVRLTAAYDPFDVIDLMRRHEFATPAPSGEPLLARVEIVAQLVTERSRDSCDIAEVDQSAMMIRDVQRHAYAILLLHNFGLISDGESEQYGPLTSLAATYAMHRANVRHMQYSSIRDDIDDALFSADIVAEAMRTTLGFSYDEFRAVRQSITTAHLVGHGSSSQHSDYTPSESIGQAGWAASFTAAEISHDTQLELGVVEAVISVSSVALNAPDMSVSARLQPYTDGDSKFQGRPLVANADGRFISLPGDIGDDTLRSIVEDSLKNTAWWSRYDRHRKHVTETMAVDTIAQILDTPAKYVSLEYLKPAAGIDIAALGPAADLSTGYHGIADQTEADALFVIDDVAICVEVKAPTISAQARRGNVKRLTSDLEKTVGSATAQTTRLHDLIAAHGGLWQPDGTWIDLTVVREIRSVAVFLDDLGPLSVAASHLQAAGLLPATPIPYLVTMHDLIVMSMLFEHPSEFLLFVRRRTDSPITAALDAVDELDVLMLFLRGELYADPDPDEVSAAYPYLGAPTARSRATFSAGTVRTMVDSHTGALDAWIQPTLLGEPPTAAKPALRRAQAVTELTDLLYHSRLPGWFRFSADLFNLSLASQTFLQQSMKKLVRKARRDRQPHTLAIPFAGTWGFPALFVASSPTIPGIKATADRLRSYMTLKKHQMGSDRALGIVLKPSHAIAAVCYDNNPITDNPELDALVAASGLMPGAGQVTQPDPDEPPGTER